MSDKKRKNAKIGDEIEFKWLKRRGRAPGDKDVCFYESFMFDGVVYSLYDCVYLFKRGQSEPYVGKLVRIWGNAKTEERKVKVLWFFRPSEISNYLQGVNVLKNEIFLGTGVGPGLTNINPLDKTKWFTTDGLWEDRINGANVQGKLVLLQNLDPTYSADEVQGIILDGFHERCTVKIVQHTATSSPHAGQAFVIFSNREVAAMVMRKLEQGCLMLPNGRPLVGTNYSMTLHGKQSQYFGHIVIEKNRQQKQKDMREAVSTSHSSQSNTLEYEMALEWQLLQDRSDLCWKYLYQDQGNEMRKLNAQLKSKK